MNYHLRFLWALLNHFQLDQYQVVPWILEIKSEVRVVKDLQSHQALGLQGKVRRVWSDTFYDPFIQKILQNYQTNCLAMQSIQWCLWSWRWLILNEKVAKCVAVFDPHDFSLQIVGRGEGRQASSKDLDMFESLVHGWLLYFLWSKCISYLICNRSNSSSVKFMFSKKATKIEKNFTVDLTLTT